MTIPLQARPNPTYQTQQYAHIVILSTLGTICRRIKCVPTAVIPNPYQQNRILASVMRLYCMWGTERRISYHIMLVLNLYSDRAVTKQLICVVCLVRID